MRMPPDFSQGYTSIYELQTHQRQSYRPPSPWPSPPVARWGRGKWSPMGRLARPLRCLGGLLLTAAAVGAIAPPAGGHDGGPPVVVSDGSAGSRLSPFPDDRFTVPDRSSPTGIRLAVPLARTTGLQDRLAGELSRLDGFGVFAPIAITFDDDLDLATVTDASVLLVNVEPGSARAGEVAPLDLGRGSYATDAGRPRSYYARDPLAGSGDLVFPAGNPGAHYEASSRTLILRPLTPLAEGARHVVVLTDRLRGVAGHPVAPPKGYVRPTTDDAPLMAALAAVGLDLDAIRYQWAFTTGTPTRELRAIGDGLDGVGPLASLAREVPPGPAFFPLRPRVPAGHPYVLDREVLGPLLEGLGDLLSVAAPLDPDARDLANLLHGVDASCLSHLAAGSVAGPELRVTPRGTFAIDLARGAVGVVPGGSRVPFLVIVPRPCAENGFARPPYPVLLFGHGHGRSRLDALAIAGLAAAHGFAVLALDAVGHGPDDALARLPGRLGAVARGDPAAEQAIRDQVVRLAALLAEPVDPVGPVEALVRRLLCGSLRPLLCDGRANDVDGDGLTDSGATFFTADVFRTRDVVRQSVVDAMVLARVFRALGVDRNGNGRLDPQEGDLDEDGILDLGGPGTMLVGLGFSEGAFLVAPLAATDPTIQRVDLMVPGGGLVDIVATTLDAELNGEFWRLVFGPVVVGDPAGRATGVEVDGAGPVGFLATKPGGKVRGRNLRTRTVEKADVEADGGFRVHIPADVGDPIELGSTGTGGARLGFASPSEGLGLERATPRLREWLGLAALALEGADPAVYAPHWRRRGTGVLVQVSLGDTTVPVFTGASLGRAGGLVSLARNDLLVREGVLAGGLRSNVDRVFPPESVRGRGIRFLGINAHAGMLIPTPLDPEDLGRRYAAAAQRQALEFLRTGLIDDSDPIFDLILPP